MTLPETKNLPLEEVLEDEIDLEAEKEEEGTEGKFLLMNSTKNDGGNGEKEDRQQKNTKEGGKDSQHKDKEKSLLINDPDNTKNIIIKNPVA